MTRTLIMRDLAEPATAGAFDASEDVYADGATQPTLGQITGDLFKRPDTGSVTAGAFEEAFLATSSRRHKLFVP